MKINNCVGGANKRKILPLPFIIISDKEFHGKKGECNIFNTNIIFQSFKGIDLFVKKEGINLLGTCTSTFKIG
jgi:hypothetical protein